MKSLLDTTVKDELLSRLNLLTASANPLWGKMNTAQMLAHSSNGLKAAMGEFKPPRAFFGYIFGGLAKKSMMSDKPFGKISQPARTIWLRTNGNLKEKRKP